jgi:hypothetical protein
LGRRAANQPSIGSNGKTQCELTANDQSDRESFQSVIMTKYGQKCGGMGVVGAAEARVEKGKKRRWCLGVLPDWAFPKQPCSWAAIGKQG